MRLGIGYDAHKLVKGRNLILGGVLIPFEKGLLGHSDADVLVHSICDAILGAINMGDIGKHFPDTDKKYKDVSSLKLLEKVEEILSENNYEINNLDSVIIAKEPKLSRYIKKMKENIAKVLKARTSDISIKAATNNDLGSLGKGDGIASYTIVSVIPSG